MWKKNEQYLLYKAYLVDIYALKEFLLVLIYTVPECMCSNAVMPSKEPTLYQITFFSFRD